MTTDPLHEFERALHVYNERQDLLMSAIDKELKWLKQEMKAHDDELADEIRALSNRIEAVYRASGTVRQQIADEWHGEHSVRTP